MLPLNASQIPKLFKEARALETASKLEQARKLYQTVLTIDSKAAPAHFQIGQIDYRLGQYALAADSLDRAVDLAPTQLAVWKLLAQTLQKLGDPKRSAAFIAKAKRVRLDTRLVLAFQDALSNTRARSKTTIGKAPPDKVRQAISLLQSGDAAGAARLAQALRTAHPDVALIADILANAQAATGKLDEAETNFHAAVTLDPGYAEAHANYGRFLVERGRPDDGIPILKTALKIAPRMANAWASLGLAYVRSTRRGPAAEAAFRKALDADPTHVLALMEYTRLLVSARRSEEAAAMARRALAAGADETDARLALARALGDLGHESEALAEIDKVLSRDPDCGPAYAAQAAVLQTVGKFNEARVSFRKTLELMPKSGETYRVFFLTEKLDADDPLIGQAEAVFADASLRDMDRAHAGFALAKVMEDTKQYDRVFSYLRPANDLVRKNFPYDMAERRDLVDEIRSTYAGADWTGRTVAGASESAPIFVTGIPRSGTTLVEQIISSHSRVTGGGELGYARAELDSACLGADGHFLPLDQISDTALALAGERSVARFAAQFPDAEIVTDKSVQTYTLIGPLRLALPRSRIVVVRRDPRDTLLSIYKNMFAEGMHLYSYSLRDLAAYFRLFEQIIDFWRQEVPDWFHEIHYEDLIADPEPQARALIAACGLEWEDSCLRFHENRRRVDTLSVHQVRQPIYRSSVKGWQRYAEDLGDLFEALGPDDAPTGAR